MTTIVHEYEFPPEFPRREIITSYNYSNIAIEELSLRYKALIEAERKHFLNAEKEYNDFIYKMDIIHQELEGKLANQQKINHELLLDNAELARRLRESEMAYERGKKATEKLYDAYKVLVLKANNYENDNINLKFTTDKVSEKNFEIHADLKHLIAEKNFLDERLADLHNKHNTELNRLNNIIHDREEKILDRDREIDRLNSELRRLQEDIHRLKMDIQSIEINADSNLRAKDLEIAHLRRVNDEYKYKDMLDIRKPILIDAKHYEETITRLKANLEEAYRTIEDLQTKKRIQIIEKPKIVEKIVQEEVYEQPIEEREKGARRGGYGGDDDDDGLYSESDVEAIIAYVEKRCERKLRNLYYIIWKLLFHAETLEALLRKAKNKAPEQPTTVEIEIPNGQLLPVLFNIYHDLRISIVEYIFEIFVRSANHAHTKKVNSLILFILNVKELKQHHVRVHIIVLNAFMRIREMLKAHALEDMDGFGAAGFIKRSPTKMNEKKKTADVEYRDMTNSWVQDTLKNIKRRRNFDRKDPENMEYLFLFRLLAIKYRVVYPLRGKAFEVDPDLATKLETKIVKAFLRVVQIEDVEA